MLDSLLTITKGAAVWMLGFIAVCIALDRVLSAMLGRQEIIFALLAVMTAVALVVTSVYTLGKVVWRLIRGDR